MKKLFTLLLLSFTISASATHLMGGEITVQDLGNNQHQITLIAYRDTIGIPMAQAANFSFQGPNGIAFTTSTHYDSVISGNLLPMYPYGVDVYLFMDTVTFPAAGQWHISWSNCCRNGAIQNLSNPLNDPMFLQTSVWVDSVAPNSSAFFLVPAAIYLPINTPWQYNPLPFDPDGDSLVWSLDQPLRSAGVFCQGYTTPPSDPLNPLTLDSVTGTISWTANTLGNFVISILVDQYRNGQWIGEIRRDMQLIVVSTGHGFPNWLSMNNQPPSDSLQLYLKPGQPLNFEIIAGHTDSTRQLYMEAFSPLLEETNSVASFTAQNTGSYNEVRGNFLFTPQQQHNEKKHFVVIRCSDGYFTTDKTVTINVSSSIGMEQAQELSAGNNLHIYPNPAQQMLNIALNAKSHEEVCVQVISMDGQLIKSVKTDAVQGANVFLLPLADVNSGIYLIKINAGSGQTYSRRFVKK